MGRTNPTSSSKPPRKRRILVISTDAGMCAAVESACDSGFEVACVSDWESGLTFLKEQHPDLMVLDDISPDDQAWSGMADVPVIVGTASKQIENWVRLMKAGAEDVLSKPINIEEIRKVMGKTLARDRTLLRKMQKIRALPLSKQEKQIPAFVQYLIRMWASETENRSLRFTAEAINLLVQYAKMHGLEKLESAVARAVILNPSAVIKPEYLRDFLDETALISRILQASVDRAWDKYDHEGEYREYRMKRRLS